MLKLNTNKGFMKIKSIFGHLSYILAALFLSLKYKAARTDVKFNGKLDKIKVIDLYEILKDYKFKKTYKGKEKSAEVKLFNDYIYFGWTNRKKDIFLK